MITYLIAACVELLVFALILLVWTMWLVTTAESNCLFFALTRLRARGGYLIMRKSRHGWFPHFLWSKDLRTFEQYVPLVPNEHLAFPPAFFAGLIRVGTDSPKTPSEAALPETIAEQKKDHVRLTFHKPSVRLPDTDPIARQM